MNNFFIDVSSHLNNEAISLLASGGASSQQIFQILKTALDIMTNKGRTTTSQQHILQLFLPSTMSSSQVESSRNASVQFSPRSAYAAAKMTTLPQQVITETTTRFGAEADQKCSKNNFLYDRMLYLTVDSTTPMRLPLYCAVIMFNMALMLHLNDRLFKGGSWQYHKTLKFYNLVLSLLDEEKQTNGSSCSDAHDDSEKYTKMLKIITLNNMALVHFELCQFEVAGKLFGSVGSTFMALNNSRSKAFLHNDDVEGILLNSMLFKMPLHAPSA